MTDQPPKAAPPVLAPPVIHPPPKRQPAPTLYFIILFKMGKGLLFIAAALVLARATGGELREALAEFLRLAHVDSNSKLFAEATRGIGLVASANPRWLAAGAALYSLFSFAEGIGLLLRTGWGAWLAIIESAIFIPVELIDLVRNFSLLLVAVLILNIAIVWYLCANRKRLFPARHS